MTDPAPYLEPVDDVGAGPADPSAYERDPAGPVLQRPGADPWAHRRGEPRLFAFLWTLYLFVTVLGSLLWLTRSGVLAASAYGPAARVMLIVIAAGATLLWPMVRLSQEAPETNPLAAAFSDLVVVVMPIQVVVWPLAFLANWPVRVVAVLSGMFLVWPALTGGVVATAHAWGWRRRAGERAGVGRTGWMLLCLASVGGGPLVIALTGIGQQVDINSWAWKLSPFTFVFVLTGSGLRGPHAPIGLHDWVALAPVAGATAVAWIVAACVAPRAGRRGDVGEQEPHAGTGPGPSRRLDSQSIS